MKQTLSMDSLKEQFGYLVNRKIHDVVGIAQEGFHSIKVGKKSLIVMKIYLSKDHDKENWVFLRPFLLQISLNI
jgi:hypothetical protein